MYKLWDLSFKVKKILLHHLSWSNFATAGAADLLIPSQVCIYILLWGPVLCHTLFLSKLNSNTSSS